MEELFLSVLNMSLTASYVIVFVMLVRLPLKKVPKVISYALWGVVAIRLLCPFSFESMFSLLPTSPTLIPQNIAYQQSPKINSSIIAVDTYVNRALPSPTVSANVNPLEVYTRISSYIWILGIAAMLIYNVTSVLILKRRLKGAQHVEQNIYMADNLKTPFVLGIIKPRIYIPAGLTAEEKSHIIRHEQAHIRRSDHMVKPLAFFILSIHWFNPLVWIAFLLMSTDMELSCDERVIKEMGSEIKKAYSASLLSLAMDRRIMNGSPLAFGEGNVKGRIKNVLNYRKPALWVIAVAVIAVIAVAIGLLSNPRKGVSPIDNSILPGEPQLDKSVPSDKPPTFSPAEVSVSYSLMKLGNGEVLRAISPLSGDNAQLAENIIFNCMIKSTVWPGVDTKTLKECYLLRATYSGGTSTDYYAYLLDGKAVMQRGPNGLYSRIDDGLYEKLVKLIESSTATTGGVDGPKNITASTDRTDLNACVANAILTANTNKYRKSDFAAEAHTVLKTVERSSATTVYAMALYMEFGYAGSGFFETGGGHMPVAITFGKNSAGEYELKEYWIPQDGSDYAPSIKEKFPSDIYKDALDTQKYIVAHIQACYAQAIEYGNAPVTGHIGKLVDTICSSPAGASNPRAYIEAHPIEYREMIYYGAYTLRHCFTLFEQGGQTGLEGHIMASACRDILGKEDIDLSANTGQDWYDAFKKSAENLRHKNGDEYMKKNMPGSWLLLHLREGEE